MKSENLKRLPSLPSCASVPEPDRKSARPPLPSRTALHLRLDTRLAGRDGRGYNGHHCRAGVKVLSAATTLDCRLPGRLDGRLSSSLSLLRVAFRDLLSVLGTDDHGLRIADGGITVLAVVTRTAGQRRKLNVVGRHPGGTEQMLIKTIRTKSTRENLLVTFPGVCDAVTGNIRVLGLV